MSALSPVKANTGQNLNPVGLKKHISDILQKTEAIKDKNIVLFFGASGAGKSTSIALLSGQKLIKKPLSEIHNAPDLPGYALVLKDGNVKSVPKIGTLQKAETIFHELFNLQGDDLKLCDSPGYNLASKVELEIAENIGTKSIINNVKAMSIVVCVELPSILSGRGQPCVECLEALRKLFPQWETELVKSLTLLVTHNFKLAQPFTRNNLLTQLKRFIEDRKDEENVKKALTFVTREEGKYIQLFTEADKEDEKGMEETKKTISKMIKEMVLIKPNPQNIGISLTDKAIVALKNTFGGIINDGNKTLDDYIKHSALHPDLFMKYISSYLLAATTIESLKTFLEGKYGKDEITTLIEQLQNDTSPFTPKNLMNKKRELTVMEGFMLVFYVMGKIGTGAALGAAVGTIPIVNQKIGPILPTIVGARLGYEYAMRTNDFGNSPITGVAIPKNTSEEAKRVLDFLQNEKNQDDNQTIINDCEKKLKEKETDYDLIIQLKDLITTSNLGDEESVNQFITNYTLYKEIKQTSLLVEWLQSRKLKGWLEILSPLLSKL